MEEVDATADRLLAFPDYQTDTTLIRRTSETLTKLGIGVLIVTPSGDVTEFISPRGGAVL